MEHFPKEAGEIVCGLRGDVVEVDPVANAVHDSEHKAGKSDDLVEGQVGIEGDVVVEGSFPEVGDEVPSHGYEQDGISEHHN